MTVDSFSDIAPSTNTSLIRRVRNGEQDAWERFVHLYSGLIYSKCRASNLTADDSADILQEVFRRVHTGLEGFSPQKDTASFRSWLRTVATHAIADHFRTIAKQYQELDAATLNLRLQQISDAFFVRESSSGDEIGNEDGERQTKVMLMAQALKQIQIDYEESTWKAFWRTTIDGQKAIDVAEELGMTHGAVRTASYTVRRRLRTELEGLI